MTPSLPKRPGTPKQFRTLLIVFIVRQILSVALLAYLNYEAYLTHGTFIYVMAAISVAFIVAATVQGIRIYGQYRRSSAHAAAVAQSGK